MSAPPRFGRPPFDRELFEDGYRAGAQAAIAAIVYALDSCTGEIRVSLDKDALGSAVEKERAAQAMDEVARAAGSRSDGGEDQGVADPRAQPENTVHDLAGMVDLELLERMAAGGGRRTGALRRRGLIEWKITELGAAILRAWGDR